MDAFVDSDLCETFSETNDLDMPHFRCIGTDGNFAGTGQTTQDPFCAILKFRSLNVTFASCTFHEETLEEDVKILEPYLRIRGKLVLGLTWQGTSNFQQLMTSTWLGSFSMPMPAESYRNCETGARHAYVGARGAGYEACS